MLPKKKFSEKHFSYKKFIIRKNSGKFSKKIMKKSWKKIFLKKNFFKKVSQKNLIKNSRNNFSIKKFLKYFLKKFFPGFYEINFTIIKKKNLKFHCRSNHFDFRKIPIQIDLTNWQQQVFHHFYLCLCFVQNIQKWLAILLEKISNFRNSHNIP